MLKTAAVAFVGTFTPSATWTTTWRPAPTRRNPPRPVRVSIRRVGVTGAKVEEVGRRWSSPVHLPPSTRTHPMIRRSRSHRSGSATTIGSTSIVYLPAGTVGFKATVQLDGAVGEPAATRVPTLLRTATCARRFDHEAVPGGGRSVTPRAPAPTSTANTSRSPVLPITPAVVDELATGVALRHCSRHDRRVGTRCTRRSPQGRPRSCCTPEYSPLAHCVTGVADEMLRPMIGAHDPWPS